MIFPEIIKKGDKVGVVAPSNVIDDALIEQFNKGVEKLRSFGLEVVLGKHVLDRHLYSAGTAQNKAEDINGMFLDSSVKAIICAQGGNTANEVLPYLDFDVIGKNPKIFMGFSDITVLLNAITFRTGLITFLGPDVIWKFGGIFSEYDEATFFEILFKGQAEIYANSEWKLLKKSDKKNFKGQLVGGNSRCFMKLLGTENFPDIKDGIMLLEEVGKSPAWFDSLFEQWKQMGLFKRLNGVIVGYNHKCEDGFGRKPEDVLVEKTEGFDLNILKINEFGHKSDHAIFPIGANCVVEFDNSKLVFNYSR